MFSYCGAMRLLDQSIAVNRGFKMKVTIDLSTVETSDELHAVLVDLLCCSALIDDFSFRDRCDVKSSLQLKKSQ